MNHQTLQFNLPEGWKVNFRLGHYEDEEIGESWDTEEYLITPDNSDLFSRISIVKDIDGMAEGPDEALERQADEYLDNLHLPASLRPYSYDFITQCEIGDLPAYYGVFQQPDEAGADIRLNFYAKDGRVIYVHAYIIDYADGCGEAGAIDFLSKFFVF